MEKTSRIRFNPVTKEVEIEGSEAFVKTYFNKLQKMISGAQEVIAEKVKKIPPAPKAKKAPKAVKARAPKKAKKAPKREPGVKKPTNISTIVALVQGSAEGISTTELKEKTGLTERQIWSIVN
ncbi:MAG: hypothetical protein V1766_10530, partial [Pseudomonadota bacterium]